MLTFPAGYYSLYEIMERLAREGLSIRVSPYCSDDVYAIRAERTDWDDLRAALVADGRLAITNDGRTWDIALSKSNREAEVAALARLTEAVRSGLQAVYGPTARQAAELWSRPEAERTVELEEIARAASRLVGSDKAMALDRLGLLAGTLTNKNNWDFQSLSLPAVLTEPGRHFGKIFGITLLDAGTILVPDGDLRKYPLVAALPKAITAPEVASFLQRRVLSGKVVWDPLTSTAGMRSAVWTLGSSVPIDEMDFGSGVQPLVAPNIRSLAAETWQPGEKATRASRRASTIEALATLPGEFDVPNRAMATSEALLRWAQGSGTDILAYVSPLCDLPLAARKSRSLASVVRDADAGAMDPASLRTALAEWTGLTSPHKEAGLSLPASHRLSVRTVGHWVVVRTEDRFLDGRTKGSVRLLSSWATARMEGQALPLTEIVRVASSFHPGNEEGGIAPLGVLAFCNPASFAPVADLLKEDPKLLAQMTSLGQGETLTRPLPHSEDFTRSAIYAGFFNDAVTYGTMDPMVWGYFGGEGEDTLEVDARHEGDRLTFEVVAPKRHENGTPKVLWSTWARI